MAVEQSLAAKPPAGGLLRTNAFFRRIWSAQTVSGFGDAITSIAVPTAAVLTLKAGAFEVGALSALGWAAWPLIGLPVGVWIDRLPRKPLLVAADLVRLGLIASVPIAWAAGRLSLVQLMVVAALAGACSVVFDLTFTVTIPDVVEPAALAEANSRLELSGSASRLTGPGLAGLLIGAIGAPLSLVTDAVSFLVSALLVSTGPELRARHAPRERRPFLREVGEGLVALREHWQVLCGTIAAALSNFALTIGQGVFYVFAYRSVHLTPALVGAAITIASVVNIAGSLASPWLTRRFGTGPSLLVSTSFEATAVLLMPLGLVVGAPVVWIAASLAMRAFFGPWWNVAAATMRQVMVPAELQGRVTAAARTIGMGATPLGGLVGGAIAAAWSPTAALVVAGIVGAFSAVPLLSRRVLAIRV